MFVLGFYFRNILFGFLQYIIVRRKFLELYISKEYLLRVLYFLGSNTKTNIKILSDICVTDFLASKYRFKISYNLLSTFSNLRVFVQTFVKENELVASVSGLYKSAG